MDAAAARRAAGFPWAFVATVAALLALFLLTVFLLDPYDTGRSPLRLKEGVRMQGPRTAAASRGRDQAFNAAIFGNSHVQMLSPEELKAKTGLAFVSLIAPASGPKETLTLIDWFLRHRREPARALVIGIDSYWCTADPTLPNERPFPYWLFSRNLAEYLSGLLRFDVFEEMNHRIRYLLAREPKRGRPDGYWDYSEGYEIQGALEDSGRQRLGKHFDSSGGNATGPFPAATALAAMLDTAPPELRLVLVRPPVYQSALPAPGSAEPAADAACRAPFQALADKRPHTAMVDMRLDSPITRDPANFYDHTHYRRNVARLVESEIAAALATLR
ncbi:hypothetical protein DWF00_10015 [Bosea caraganae]|uniref:Uncharacterized protein n=1 Tax=Bosea caraganae TaxID=2763117 RepID=A0A370LBG4_9HYPH|nr:hypothetical protein [Bosea caraganae]RDJ27297.1 hypothetical protein DWF00_10015 [Bosea caraganae]RDJ29313.1 hypothetical protein DWE98_01785 [Bosea caraganae]